MNEIIIRKIFEKLDKNVNKIVSASNSYNSNVYIIESDNDKYVFKISNNKQKRENECKYYNYLSKIIPTAKVLDSGEINDIQYNIITFLEGVNLFDEECNSLNENQIYNIGKLLAKVHTADLIDEDNDSWILYLNNVLEKTNDTLENIFSNDNKIIVDFLNKFIRLHIKDKYKNSILHMDFRVGNIVIENEEVKLIDLESMKNGDYVFDFVKMNRIFTKDNFEIFINGYKSIKELDTDFYNKLKFYSFFDSYTSLYWCVSKNSLDTDFYRLNFNIVMNFLGEIKNGEWNI